MEFKYYSVKHIQNFINSHNLSINKSFGQNFLINAGVTDTIADRINAKPEDTIVEIGCGLGSLTNRLVDKGNRFIGFEIDKAYIKHLKDTFGHYSNFNLVEGDFLKTARDAKEKFNLSGKNVIFTGNLPYNITTPIIEMIFKVFPDFKNAAFMMQKEVAERVISPEGSKKYGSLSIFCQYNSIPKIIARVHAASFYPKPKIDSTVVLFEPRLEKFEVDDEAIFFKLVKSLFHSRRKQIKNNLTVSPYLSYLPKDIIYEALDLENIPHTQRGENLSIEQIVSLSNRIFQLSDRSKKLDEYDSK